MKKKVGLHFTIRASLTTVDDRRNKVYIKATNAEEHKRLDCMMCFYAGF